MGKIDQVINEDTQIYEKQ
jgi:hypothetical protein